MNLLPSEYIATILEKSKALPEGTVRDWKGKDYKKVSGKWIKQKKGGTKRISVEKFNDSLSRAGIDSGRNAYGGVTYKDHKGNWVSVNREEVTSAKLNDIVSSRKGSKQTKMQVGGKEKRVFR